MKEAKTKKNRKLDPIPHQDQATEDLKDTIVQELSDRKAEDLVVIDLRGIEKAVADYFVVATGTSNTHLSSLAEHVEEAAEEFAQEKVWSKEGHHTGEWIVLDYATTVVHLFKRDSRAHYGLEELWGDGVILHIGE